jgi:hypothetical protein
MVEEKKCLECDETFTKRPETSMRTWLTRKKYCSVACLTQSKKGGTPWNKGRLEEPNEYTTFGDITVMYIESTLEHETREVILDTSVHENIKKYRWTTYGKKPNNDYAWRNDFGPLHRHVLGLPRNDKTVVDHINRNRFDNRLCNIRATNQFVNMRNHNMFKTNTSGHNGVQFEKDRRKWTAKLCIDGTQKRIGSFDNKNDAIVDRSSAEQRYWKPSNQSDNGG